MEEKKLAKTKSNRVSPPDETSSNNLINNKLTEIKVKSFSRPETSNENDEDIYTVKVSS